jgi:hypothetical protein
VCCFARWLVEEKSSFGLYSMRDVLAQTTVWERILPKLFYYGRESRPCPDNGSTFPSIFWKHDRWRFDFPAIVQNMVDGIWMEIVYTGRDALSEYVVI